MKGIERRVQLLSGLLASPVSEDDYAEKGRRVELRRFVSSHTNVCWFTYLSLRKLEGVVMKLEPLAEQHMLIGFLHNVNNAKTLTGYIQELSDAIMDYQVCVVCPTVICTELLPRCQYNKELTRGQGKSAMIPRISLVV